jgi:hypothetical protein
VKLVLYLGCWDSVVREDVVATTSFVVVCCSLARLHYKPGLQWKRK